MRLTRATAALLTGLAVFSIPAPMLAQTSFGAGAAARPATDRDGWMRAADAAFGRSLRNADSSLATYGGPKSIRAVVRLTILPDGRVERLEIVESSGSAGIDDGLRRALSRLTQVQPFTPDMPPVPVTIDMGIGTTRG